MLSRVTQLLGREPRGLEEVAVVSSDGDPVVIRVASLVENTPFPTLFWLVDRDLCYRIDREEATGLIKRLQAEIDSSPALRDDMEQDHRAHIALRQSYILPDVQKQLESLGFGGVLDNKGIGGIADFTRVRCLHTWYAAHLVVPNTVGKLLDIKWRQRDV